MVTKQRMLEIGENLPRPSRGHIETKGPHLPPGVISGSYRCAPPLIRPSKLTIKEKGGVGKQLSDGWNLNFAVGCIHACPFCYVDAIHKRFGESRYGPAVHSRWGDYFLAPSNLEDAITRTPWRRWAGKEAMMSSTHDPYLPTLAPWARRILAAALPAGVRICLQTRSFLVTKDLDFLASYQEQVRLQASLATMNRDLARLIEPRVPPPEARLEMLRRAKKHGLKVGVILAPIFPPTRVRPDFEADLVEMIHRLEAIQPDHVYGESLHARGENMSLVEKALGERVTVNASFDEVAERVFRAELKQAGIPGTWWPD